MIIGLPPQNNIPQCSIYEIQTPTSQSGSFVFDFLKDIKNNNDLSYTFQTFENKFNSLSLTWKHDTLYSSGLNEIISNKAYLQIIAMGEKALPLIFKSMESEPHHWFIALTSITGGVNPVKPEHRGNVPEMTHDWLEWAKINNYVA